MIGVVLVGAGAVVQEHYCHPLRRLEKGGAVRVVAVVDPDVDRARGVAGRFKAARAYPDTDSAWAGGSYDLAIVASPPGLHADHACDAFRHGCHVLCEKPMTVSTDEAARMNAAAAAADRVLGVAFPRRFYANVADVARLIRDGELGENVRFTHREGSTYSWSIATGAAFQREKSGGGALLDRGVHMLDQLNWLFGGPVVVDRAYDDSLQGGVETNSRLELTFPRAVGTMQVSWEFPLYNQLHVWGTAGEVILQPDDIRTYLRKTTGGWLRVPAKADWPADMARVAGKRFRPANGQDCFEAELIAMLRCIAFGEAYPVTGVQAQAVQAAIEDAYRQAQPLECSWLSADEQAAARARHWRVVETR